MSGYLVDELGTSLRVEVSPSPMNVVIHRYRALSSIAAVLGTVVLAVASVYAVPISPDLAPPVATAEDTWVEAQLAAMDLPTKIGQLFFARAHSDGSEGSLASVQRLVTKQKVGGVVFFSGTPSAQATWTNQLQASAKTPLLVAVDAEWGLAMRFGDEAAARFPYALTMGAANDEELTREIGRETGRQLRRLGVHMSFAPVADLNTNYANPIIGRRSFGEIPLRSGRLATAYARGLRDANVLAVAKHFPGHGDTDRDSHVTLPTVGGSRARLDSVELLPFRMLTQDGVAGVMTAHLNVPALDPSGTPSSLSPAFAQDLLRGSWDYEGLIVTDGLDMAAVSELHPAGELAVRALLAGNDILLIPEDIPAGIAGIQRAVTSGRVSRDRLEASVRRILRAKYKAGLTQAPARIFPNGLRSELNSPRSADLSERLYRRAITVVRHSTVELPLLRIDTLSTAILSLGTTGPTPFQHACADYARNRRYTIEGELSGVEQTRWVDQLSAHELVIVGLHDMSWRNSDNYGILQSHLSVLRRIPSGTEVVIVLFGSPYALELVADFENLLVAYEDEPLAQKAAAEVIYGATPGFGSLPVTTRYGFRAGLMSPTASAFRLRRSTPGNAGFSESDLRKVDELAEQAIRTRATPGGVVLAAHDGDIGLLRAYGRHTYEKSSPEVDPETVYDLASITKIAAATISIMRLHEEGTISVYDRIDKHLPWLKGTNKGALRINDMLAHRARLKPWIPFYERTIVKSSSGRKSHNRDIYASSATGAFSVPVTEKLFITGSYRDSIYQLISDSELRTRSGYRYSDLGFYLMAAIVEEKTGYPLDEYAEREFYRPLGLRTMGYNPLKRMDVSRVPPTEEDNYFRFGTVQGYVHDMGAAMLGGVSGHAGLFSNARDLAVLMQMLLNKGYYGGRRYFKPETVALFTTRHPQSTRRALGFDMAELSSRGSTNMSPLASAKTFGHLGFTGTCAWADPETGIVFVWLTNRTYPRMSPNKFGKENYRPRMQGAVYEALR